MDNSASLAGSGLCVGELSTLDLNNTIVAFNHGGQAVCCWLGTGGSATLICCDVFGNEGGDWVDCIEDQAGVEGNICLDPFFCGFDEGDYRLRSDSPCAPDFNPECGLIGALPVGCGGSPTFETSWGAMKALFRGDAK